VFEVGLCHGTIILPSRATGSGHTIVRLRDRLTPPDHWTRDASQESKSADPQRFHNTPPSPTAKLNRTVCKRASGHHSMRSKQNGVPIYERESGKYMLFRHADVNRPHQLKVHQPSHDAGHVICGCPIRDFFSCPPGMALSSGADCSPPGISPRPLWGSRPTQGRLNVPRPVGIARHPTRAMRRAVLNPGRNTCFVTGCNAGDERAGGRWCLCGSCVRWPADLLEPLPHVRGGPPNTGRQHHKYPPDPRICTHLAEPRPDPSTS
jgi:hypothetical protein